MVVHAGCYGVQAREGQEHFRCDACTSGASDPVCVLCPNQGGAMKQVQARNFTGERWAHVNCVLWMPEVRCAVPGWSAVANLVSTLAHLLYLLASRCALAPIFNALRTLLTAARE